VSKHWLFRPSPPIVQPPVCLPVLAFKLSVKAPPSDLRSPWDEDAPASAVLRFSFGDLTASQLVGDIWLACCEIYLQAQLAKQSRLDGFYLNGEQLFTIAYFDDVVLCSWSRDHMFAVKQRELVDSFEALVEQALDQAPHWRREAFVHLGASLIQNQPRFAALAEVGAAC
jgi:hypothetical protein